MKRTLFALGFALLLAVFCEGPFKPLQMFDNTVGDTFYQSPKAGDKDIVIFGIDEKSLEVFGQWQSWRRTIIAEGIAKCNADPDNKPAVIGVDVLFPEESADKEADAALAAAAEQNVVLAAALNISSDIKSESFTQTADVLRPFPALLQKGASIGIINGNLDADGVLRRAGLQTAGNAGFAFALQEKITGRDVSQFPARASNFIIDYTAKPGAVGRVYSFADLFERTPAELDLGGKIVFIGPYARGLADQYITAIDKQTPMYGVEVQANILKNILDENFHVPVNWLLQTGIVFLAAFLGALLFARRHIWISLLILAVLAAGAVGASVLLYKGGTVTHPLDVPFVLLITFVVMTLQHISMVLKEKNLLMHRFGQYLSPDVVREIIKTHPDNLTAIGKTANIAVLFVDIRGFTPLSEACDPATIVGILNEYLTLTTRCVMNNNGTLDKFIGDCTMAFWGAPVPCDDPVYDACKAAQQMTQESKPLRERILRDYGKKIAFGVGVHYGEAVVGNIGSTMRMDYTAIGDTVNTAARLEENAPGGTIYISRAVAEKLGDRAVVAPLETPIRLKGKSDFEILSLESLK